MAIIVQGGDRSFAALAFGTPHPRTIMALENQFANLGNQISASAQQFVDQQRAMFEKFNGSEALRLAKAAMRAVTHAFTPNVVQPLMTIGAIQQAPEVMQRYIMANPVIRTYYQEQRCDGWSDSYIDEQPGVKGMDHVDYRQVIDGMIQELPDSEDGQGDWKIVFTWDKSDDAPDLTFSERVDILMTWQIAEALMGPGREDPTSPYADKM